MEVRSEHDYGAGAEREIDAKRADYFAAGTRVVWDVDPLAAEIRSYAREAPTTPVIYRRGTTAEAPQAAPGWRIDVDRVFEA